MPRAPRIDITDEPGGLRSVRFRDRHLYDDPTVREVTDQLFAALPPAGTPPRLVIDFAGVESVSSSLLGKLVLLQRQVDARGGRLVICELTRAVEGVFRAANLTRIFAVARDRREAIELIGG